MTASRKGLTSIENTNIVEPQEAALKNVQSFRILSIDPPCKVEHQFVEHSLQKRPVSTAMLFLIYLINTPGCPCKHRWIDISKRPFIGGHLSIRMLIPFTAEQEQLLLGELGIKQCERDAVKS